MLLYRVYVSSGWQGNSAKIFLDRVQHEGWTIRSNIDPSDPETIHMKVRGSV